MCLSREKSKIMRAGGSPCQLTVRADDGDCGFGFCANSLVLGCDCVGHISYLDGVINDVNGAA